MTRFPLSPNASRLMAACDTIFGEIKMTKPTAEQLDKVLNILTNARDAALIAKLAIELGLETDALTFIDHLRLAAKAVGQDLLPVRVAGKYFDSAADIVGPR